MGWGGWGGWGGPDRLPCRAQAKLDWAGLRQFKKKIVYLETRVLTFAPIPILVLASHLIVSRFLGKLMIS